MNPLNKICRTALTGLAAFGFASASYATPVEGSPDAHDKLLAAILSNGVNVVLNDKTCVEDEKLNGYYSGQRKLLVVCQDDHVAGGPSQVRWTANDLDTLRHEAQHMIQDCRVGTNHDHQLSPVYNRPTDLAIKTLGVDRVNRIRTVYRENGATDLVVLLEYEAFAVAHKNVPFEQAGDVVTYCGAS